MASSWREARVEDIAAPKRNAIVGGPFGSNLVQKDYVDDGVPVIRGQNLSGRWVSGDFAYVTLDKAEELSANLAHPRDIIFTQRGTIGQVAVLPLGGFDRYLVSQSQMKLSVNEEIADPLFYYYVFRSGPQQEYVRQHAIQTGVPHTNLSILRATPIPLPPLSEQRAIARILGALDDKIELSCRTNETLEAMARVLFKSWFIDFDPVRAKAEGQDPCLAQEFASLFPTSFDQSDLGDIPQGWQIGRLDDIVVLQRGFDLPSASRSSGPYPIIAASGPSGFHDEPMVRGPGVVTGRSGVLGRVFFVHEDFWPLNTSLWVKEFKRATPAYAFYLLRLLDLAGFNAGSAVPTLNRNHIHNLPYLLPPDNLVRAFDDVAMQLLRRQRASENESSTLAALRDTLLPKLVSGEIRVKDAEKLAEAVA